jgi:type IX secretion system PorP/SprF family membrane protein
MKYLKLIIILLIVFGWRAVWAQQDPMFTQYTTNPVTVNPAIAGFRKVDNISLVSRKQWVGIDGAPTTVTLAYQGSFSDDNVGLGLNLIHDRLGPVVQTGVYFDYAYHLILDNVKRSRLSLGVMGGFNYYVYDLLSLYYNDSDDDITNDGYDNKFLPNFGVGIFYHNPKYFMGISVPKILRNSLSDSDNTLTVSDKEERHSFVMAGGIFILAENIKFKPSFIIRGVNGSPASVDLNATVMLYDKIWLGAMYRIGSSGGGIIRWQLNDNLHVGYSFDFATSRLKAYNSGTHEVLLSLDIFSRKPKSNVERIF